MSPSTAEWLLEIGGLTVGVQGDGGIDVVDHCIALADQLHRASAAHAPFGMCVPEAGRPCALHAFDGGHAACRLAQDLAASYQGDIPFGEDPDRVAQAVVQAIRAASTAVFHCRRHAHPTGECWFSGDGTDACGDVLAVAHRIVM